MRTQDEKLLRRIEKEKARRLEVELQGRRDRNPNLLSISRAIDEYVCLNKLKLYTAYLSYTKFTNANLIDYDKESFLFINEVIEQTSIEQYENPLIKIFNWIRKLYEGIENPQVDDERIYYQIASQLKELIRSVSNEEQVEVYSYFTNYCIYKINHQQNNFLKPFIEYSIQILDIKSKTHGKRKRFLPPTIFRNIVKATLHLRDDHDFFQSITKQLRYSQADYDHIHNGIEWTEMFIKQYKSRLSQPDAEYYYTYCIALLCFVKGEIGKAYRFLNHPKRQRGMFINLNTRSLYLVILFEVFNKRPTILESDDIEISKVIESFRGLIRDDSHRKKQLSKNYLEIYKTFGLLYKRLYGLNLKYRGIKEPDGRFERAASALEKDIKASRIPFKDWMLQKIRELKCSY